MKRRMSSVIVLIAGSLALFPALAHGTAATRTVAFHGTYKATLHSIPNAATRRGTGQASQLGKSRLDSMDKRGGQYGGAGAGAAWGEGTLTATGGSVLRYAYVTEWYVDDKTPSQGYYVFEGGTGRFYGASGTGSLRSLLRGPSRGNLTEGGTMQVTLVFQGTLNLVK